MAEPARQFDDDNVPGNIDSSSPGKPRLTAHQGGSESTPRSKDHLSSVEADDDPDDRQKLAEDEQRADGSEYSGGQSSENQSAEPSFYKNGGSGGNSTSDKEQSFYKQGKGTDPTGRGRNAAAKGKGFLRKELGKRNRIFLMGGSGGILILLIVLFSILAPFKILHIVNNLQNRFYSTGENAVQKETNVLFSNYLKRYVMPALRDCDGTIDRSCNPIKQGSLVTQLYKGWRNARLEDAISNKYGIEFSYNKYSKLHYIMRVASPSGGGGAAFYNIDELADLKSNETLDDLIIKDTNGQFKNINRVQLRATINNALENETKWKRVLYRFKIGTFMETKYGIKRCIIACGTRDKFGDWKNDKTRAAKIIFAQRVIEPRSEMMGLVMGCIFDGGCDTENTENGQQRTAFETKVQQKLDDFAAKYGEQSVADLVKLSNDIGTKGFEKYAIDKVVGTLIGRTGGDAAAQAAAADVAVKAIPIVGWANTAAKVVSTGSAIGTDVKRYTYVVNAAGMVSTYMTYRTFADEIKTGKVDPTIVGSFTNALGPGDINSTGGTASAEESPLYNSLLGNNSNVFSKTNLCNDGKPLPTGEKLCPEEKLGGGNEYANRISAFFNQDYMKPVVVLAKVWNETGGKVTGVLSKIIGSIVQSIPGVSSIEGLVGKAASPLIHVVVDQLITSPFSLNMSGSRTFDMMAGGADVSGNDYAHYGLGGQRLSDQQVATIVSEQNQQDLQSYKSEPFLARLFDTSSNYSPASKLAMAMPSSLSSVGQSIASIFTNPLGKLGRALASIFNPSRAFAAAAVQPDPFGVSQYGYGLNDPVYAQDPDAYWSTNCTSDGTTIDWAKPVNKDWQDNVTINSDTGMPEHATTDPCLLILAAVGGAGAIYDQDLLGNSGPTGIIAQPGSTQISGDSQQLAQQILANNKIDKSSGRLVRDDLEAAAKGQPGSSGVMLSSAILRFIAAVGQSHSISISAIQSGGTGHSNGSQHYSGDAVDFNIIDGNHTTGRDAGAISIINIAVTVLPQGSRFGQAGCSGSKPSLPAGFSEIEDSCNHLHVDVPDKTP